MPEETLVGGLAEDLEESYKNLAHCGFSKVSNDNSKQILNIILILSDLEMYRENHRSHCQV